MTRTQQVDALISKGLTVRQIAEVLGVTPIAVQASAWKLTNREKQRENNVAAHRTHRRRKEGTTLPLAASQTDIAHWWKARGF